MFNIYNKTNSMFTNNCELMVILSNSLENTSVVKLLMRLVGSDRYYKHKLNSTP